MLYSLSLVCSTLASLAVAQSMPQVTDYADLAAAAAAAQADAIASIHLARSQGLAANSAAVQSLIALQSSIVAHGLNFPSATVSGVIIVVTDVAVPSVTVSVSPGAAPTASVLPPALPSNLPPVGNVPNTTNPDDNDTGDDVDGDDLNTLISSRASDYSGSLVSVTSRLVLSTLPPASRASNTAGTTSGIVSSGAAAPMTGSRPLVGGLVAITGLALGALLIL